MNYTGAAPVNENYFGGAEPVYIMILLPVPTTGFYCGGITPVFIAVFNTGFDYGFGHRHSTGEINMRQNRRGAGAMQSRCGTGLGKIPCRFRTDMARPNKGER